MIKKEEALSLKVGDVLYICGFYNSTGEPAHFKVSGAVKQWKTRDNFRVPIKHGLYDHSALTMENLDKFSLERPENVNKREVKQLNAAFMGI